MRCPIGGCDQARLLADNACLQQRRALYNSKLAAAEVAARAKVVGSIGKQLSRGLVDVDAIPQYVIDGINREIATFEINCGADAADAQSACIRSGCPRAGFLGVMGLLFVRRRKDDEATA